MVGAFCKDGARLGVGPGCGVAVIGPPTSPGAVLAIVSLVGTAHVSSFIVLGTASGSTVSVVGSGENLTKTSVNIQHIVAKTHKVPVS